MNYRNPYIRTLIRVFFCKCIKLYKQFGFQRKFLFPELNWKVNIENSVMIPILFDFCLESHPFHLHLISRLVQSWQQGRPQLTRPTDRLTDIRHHIIKSSSSSSDAIKSGGPSPISHHVCTWFLRPTKPSPILEPHHTSINVSKLHKTYRSADIYYPKSWNDRSGGLLAWYVLWSPGAM